MITTYRIPCTIQATNNDHLMIAELKLSKQYAPAFVTGLRAILDAKLHELRFSDKFRDLPIIAEGEELRIEFGGHICAEITADQLETLEYYTIDWLLERISRHTRCNFRLSGTNGLSVDFALKIKED